MTGVRRPSRTRDERGSMAVEVVFLIPVMFVLTLLIVAGGRYVGARADMDAAARDAARAASLTRSSGEAVTAVHRVVAAELRQGRSCTPTAIDTGDFVSGGKVVVRLHCTVSWQDLGLLGIKGDVAVDSEGHAPIDTYRRTG